MQSSVAGHTGSVAADRGLWSMGAVAVVHGLICSCCVESSLVKVGTQVPCIGRWILIYSTTREALLQDFDASSAAINILYPNILYLQECLLEYLLKMDLLGHGNFLV